MTEILIIQDYSIAVHYFNSRRSNKSNETQLRNRSLSFKLESPKYIISNHYDGDFFNAYNRSQISQTGHNHLKVVNNFLRHPSPAIDLAVINIRKVDVTLVHWKVYVLNCAYARTY